MRIQLTRRLGQNEPGAVLDRRDLEAVWLIQQGHAIQLPDTPHPQPDAHEVDEDTDEVALVDSSDADHDEELPRNLVGLQELATKLGVATYGTKAQLRDRINEARQDV